LKDYSCKKEIDSVDELLTRIKACDVCKPFLPHGPRPVMSAGAACKIVIIGQAPGKRVHESGIPWKDASGAQLRRWLGISEDIFYSDDLIALLPMGFCYPGKGKSGDLPPREECAPLWHPEVLDKLTQKRLTLLVGQYSQRYYLGESAGRNLTETIRNHQAYLPDFLPLPHPSPRNRFWLGKNPWFEDELIPVLRNKVSDILNNS
jgi:uracil-DNA glycosylase